MFLSGKPLIFAVQFEIKLNKINEQHKTIMTFKEAQDKALELFWKIRPQAQARNLDAAICLSVDGTTYGEKIAEPYETLSISISYFTNEAGEKHKYNQVLRFYAATFYDDLEARFAKLEDDLKKEGFAL